MLSEPRPTVQKPLGLVSHYGGDSDDADESDSASADAQATAASKSGTARMIQQAAEERRAAAAAGRERAAQRKQSLSTDPEHAKFESHSKGIGSKLLKAMGWKPGEGLGPKRDGIAKPLTAAVRPKLAGLGAAGGEKGLEQPGVRPQKGEKNGDTKAPGGRGESNFKLAWQTRNRKRAAAKEVFKTADELLEEREGAEAGVPGMAGMTILDMTGPQTRVVTDMAQLSAKGEGAADEDAHFPELQHNLKLLVELAEADIHQLVRPPSHY